MSSPQCLLKGVYLGLGPGRGPPSSMHVVRRVPGQVCPMLPAGAAVAGGSTRQSLLRVGLISE